MIEVGQVVAIQFWDHVEDFKGLADITVWGRLVAKDRQSYTIDSWAPTDPKSPRKAKWNDRKTFIIARGAVIEVRRLVEKR